MLNHPKNGECQVVNRTGNIKVNIFANYTSQLYMAIIGIVMVPTYVRFLGLEAYALVGFFALLQGWFQLLDMGLTPTLMREIARYRGGVTSASSLRHLLRILEGIFISLALVGMTALVLGSKIISTHWLKAQQLPLGELHQAVAIMGIIIAARWVAGLYRGVINGYEKLVWLSGFNIVIASLKNIAVILAMLVFGKSIVVFFTFQILAALIELGALVLKSYSLLPKCFLPLKSLWDFRPIKDVLRFSLGIAVTGALWVATDQSAALVLSKMLKLKMFGFFTMANIASNGIMMLSGPISGALLPRMAKLVAENKERDLLNLYVKSTELIAMIIFPAAMVLAVFGGPVLWVWTGNSEVAANAGPVLALYAIGNGILALIAFPYYLQYAKGKLRMHIIGSLGFLAFYLPALIILTSMYGGPGSGVAWVAVTMLYLALWVPKIHSHFFPGLNRDWFLALGRILVPTALYFALVSYLTVWRGTGRLGQGVALIGIGVFGVLIAAVSSIEGRAKLLGVFRGTQGMVNQSVSAFRRGRSGGDQS